jgi:hypothetical protein
MIVSGLTIESRKITGPKKTNGTKDSGNIRPSSYELPEINEPRALTSSKLTHNSNKHAFDHSLPKPPSYKKIKTASKANYSSENSIPLKKRDSGERKEFRSIKEVSTKIKKLELNKSAIDDCLYENEENLLAYYRYAPISIIAVSGMR